MASIGSSPELTNLTTKVQKDQNSDEGSSDGSSVIEFFEDSLPSLFGHSAFACGSSRSRPFVYHPPLIRDSINRDHLLTKTISLQVSDPPSQLTSLQAHHIWISSIYMADLIHTAEIDCRERRILELGAGAGLSSVAAGMYGSPRRIVTSDWPDDQILQILNDNLASNLPDCHLWHVSGHRWGSSTDELLLKAGDAGKPSRFDILLLADVIWFPDSHEVLLETISNTLSHNEDAIAYLTAGLHGGHRAPIQNFASRAQARGFSVKWIREVRKGLEEPRIWYPYIPPSQEVSRIEESGIVVFFSLQFTDVRRRQI
ncbi:hypothetical protein DFH28DRAFT_261759 [Melampsora americana]|nr:hypothetical protein DFH28DRAFT_261759 [Melampsora americana]